MAAGENLTLWLLAPVLGLLVGLTHAKAPGTLAEPPVNTELLRACPYVIGEAEGQLLITGVPLAMVKVATGLVEPRLLDAVNVEEKVPALVGVPLINPFVAMLNPYADRILVPLNVIGAVPLAVTVLLNGTPTVPAKELVDVKVGGVFVETTEVVART